MRFWSAHRGRRRMRVIDLNWSDWAKGSRAHFEWWTSRKKTEAEIEKQSTELARFYFRYWIFFFLFLFVEVFVYSTLLFLFLLASLLRSISFAARLCVCCKKILNVMIAPSTSPHIVFQLTHRDNAASVTTIQMYAASRAHAIRACIGFCIQYLPSAAVGGVYLWCLVADGARARLVLYRTSMLRTRFRCDAEAATLEIVK